MKILPFVMVSGALIWLGACSGGSGALIQPGDGADGGLAGSGATGAGGAGAAGDGIDVEPGGPCTPKTCSELGKDCGTVGDGCGEVLDCGGCEDGDVCGVVEPNVCGDPAGLCQRTSKDEACADKECGLEGDGCDGTHDCGSCPEGEICGAQVPFQCGVGGGGECAAPVESCAAAGAECGIIGDGCGGVIDCNAESGGGCAPGTYCGVVAPSRCDEPPPCVPTATSCTELGWECGIALDNCGNQYSCADEGRGCGPLQTCVGGVDAPTACVTTATDCPLCEHVPSCDGEPQLTRITGRVVTPGRDDANTGNQVGVPNAFVYILRSNDPSTLPELHTGLPEDDEVQRCDRCEDDVLGPVLTGAVSDAKGEYTLEGNIPVGVPFRLVVKVGKFRRAVQLTIPAGDACKTTALPTAVAGGNPTRLPRHLQDGDAVNIPHVAIATGNWDAMECVFEKMGIDHAVFTRPQLDGRIHLYRDNGAWPDAQSRSCGGCSSSSCRSEHCGGSSSGDRTSFLAALNADRLHENGGRIGEYDMVVSDCRGNGDNPPGSDGEANIRRYVNRGGRLFASHWSDNWIRDGSVPYDAGSPLTTGLGPAATWGSGGSHTNGTGVISQNPPRTHTSPRIQTFIDWMVNEGAVPSAANLTFTIPEPRSRAHDLGPYTEEFAYCTGSNCVSGRPHQLGFFTPYAPPEADAACGRVVYSGFHVSVTGTSGEVFPEHCTGDLSPTEKSLLYLLFDLGACVGDEPTPPTCTPDTECPPDRCGTQPDGCGGSIDCGPCVPTCTPRTCASEGAECGVIGDGCGGVDDCGPCPPGQVCGAQAPNQCGTGTCTPQGCPEGAECGQTGDGCGSIVSCGTCPSGQVCGLEEPFKCSTAPGCKRTTCESAGAECGVIPDGCGGVDDCGDCPPGSACGLNEPNKCGTIR